jgi:hypothetical protein
MSQVKEILLPDGSCIYVEMEEAEIAEVSGFKPGTGLPEGAEQTGAVVDKVVDTMQVLKDTLHSMISTVYEGIKKHQPDEWILELSIGFKGKTNPIPVILSGESEVAMKVTAKWKKPEEKK